MSINQEHSMSEREGRRPYERPHLIEYGDVRRLTLGGGGGQATDDEFDGTLPGGG